MSIEILLAMLLLALLAGAWLTRPLWRHQEVQLLRRRQVGIDPVTGLRGGGAALDIPATIHIGRGDIRRLRRLASRHIARRARRRRIAEDIAELGGRRSGPEQHHDRYRWKPKPGHGRRLLGVSQAAARADSQAP